MKEIYTNLFIGNDDDCATFMINPEFSIIHACKTCHQKAIGYKGVLPPTHPNYLIYENGTHLFLNMVDMPNELLPKFTNPIFNSAMSFIKREIQNKKILIHCNMGQSRSPSLGLAYLSIIGIISNNSYETAMNEFRGLYPGYLPGTGIMLYMKHNWDYLMNINE
jgi:hypothetical protein